MELTESQKEYLKNNIEQFFKVFVEKDKDLASSNCFCCEDKRKLLKELLKH